LNVLVIVPHPDDEVLGMGATIKKLSKKNKISLCVVSEGASAQYKDKKMIEVRREACIKAGKILGISDFEFLNFPDMRLDTIPHLEINIQLEKIIKKYKPEVVYTSPPNDLNKDHQSVFESTLVATRPTLTSVKMLLCYEMAGFVREPFHATVYEDITKEMDYKIRAFKAYDSEVMKFPHSRSIEAIENLAIMRGIQSGLRRAEAFDLIRNIIE
jgi:LmbE family N-acetylglucosaminyl deacetylase